MDVSWDVRLEFVPSSGVPETWWARVLCPQEMSVAGVELAAILQTHHDYPQTLRAGEWSAVSIELTV